MLVELKTTLGEQPEVPTVDCDPEDVMRVSKYMRRNKYMLHVAFLDATMIYDTDAPVEFEISIGESIYVIYE